MQTCEISPSTQVSVLCCCPREGLSLSPAPLPAAWRLSPQSASPKRSPAPFESDWDAAAGEGDQKSYKLSLLDHDVEHTEKEVENPWVFMPASSFIATVEITV